MLFVVKRASTWGACIGWPLACVCCFCVILIIILFVFVWLVSCNQYLYAYKISISSRMRFYIHMQMLSVIVSLSINMFKTQQYRLLIKLGKTKALKMWICEAIFFSFIITILSQGWGGGGHSARLHPEPKHILYELIKYE